MRVLIFTFLTTLSTIIYSNQGKLMKELNIIPRPESIKINNGTTEINRSEANMISYPSFWEQLSIVTGELEVSAH